VIVGLVGVELGGTTPWPAGRRAGPRIEGTASTSGANIIESWVLASDNATPRGMPCRSTIR